MPELSYSTLCRRYMPAVSGDDADAICRCLSTPARMTRFSVAWMDDGGHIRVNTGFYAAFGAGDGAAGLMLRPGLTAEEAEARAFYAMLAACLCRQGAAGAFCGADIDTAALSRRESMAFCQAFAEALGRCAPGLARLYPSECAARRELDFLAGRLEPETVLFDAVAAVRARGFGLCRFAGRALAAAGLGQFYGRAVAVRGKGPTAVCVRESAVRLGARVTADDAPADVYFLCDDTAPLTAPEAKRLLAHRPAAVLEGMSLAAEASAAHLLRRAGVLFAPGFAAGAGALAIGADAPEDWAREKALRTAMDDILCAAMDAQDGDLYRGAWAAALARAADALHRRGLP